MTCSLFGTINEKVIIKLFFFFKFDLLYYYKNVLYMESQLI